MKEPLIGKTNYRVVKIFEDRRFVVVDDRDGLTYGLSSYGPFATDLDVREWLVTNGFQLR